MVNTFLLGHEKRCSKVIMGGRERNRYISQLWEIIYRGMRKSFTMSTYYISIVKIKHYPSQNPRIIYPLLKYNIIQRTKHYLIKYLFTRLIFQKLSEIWGEISLKNKNIQRIFEIRLKFYIFILNYPTKTNGLNVFV